MKLTPLNDAVTSWTQMVSRLEKLKPGADAMKGHAEKAEWRGENASITKPFVGRTAKEFHDAVTEARSVRDLLKDALDKIRDAKSDLRRVYESPPAGIVIHANGVLSHRVHPDRRSADNTDPMATQADFDHLRKRLEAILQRAADADELCSWGLKSLVKGHPNDFGSTRYDSLKDARRARQEIQDREDGKEAAQLYGRIDTLDGKERDHLLHLVERGMNSPAFSAELLTHLDYRGSADQEALLRIAQNLEGGGQADRVNTKLLAALSTSVATATAPGSPLGPSGGVSSDWTFKLIDLARNGNGLPDRHPGRIKGGLSGFSVLTDLMAAGTAKYDGRFLGSVGISIRNWEENTDDPYAGVMESWKGTRADPMGGLMEAFTRNPEAAEAFFDPSKNDNLDYFLDKREWPGGEVENKMPEDAIARSARRSFGEALEAAVTGNPPGETLRIPAEHSEAQSAIFQNTVEAYGRGIVGDPAGEMPAGLRRPMAGMFADFAGDVHELLGKKQNLPSSISGLTIDPKDMVPTLRAVAEDGNAFGRVQDALVTYTAQRVDTYDGSAFLHDGGEGSPSRDLAAFVQQSNQAVGHMDAIRADVIYQAGEDEKSINNWNKSIQYHVIGAPVTGIPLAGDTLQRLVDLGTTEYMNNLNTEVDKETRRNLAGNFSAGHDQIEKMIEVAVKDKVPKEQWPLMDKDPGHFESNLQNEGRVRYNLGLTGGAGYMGKVTG
ncbi:hypothetical protein B7C62_18595 [Kitasatospora albolonga]|uniref:Uncharacterized protein n=1 Tax=Kitasatospora albolonga TaxID=68173 RepID=A0ABC8BU80_9ACTN|nr:hypothetical protein B7C62_18595 [Kitasatospora albolonga]